MNDDDKAEQFSFVRHPGTNLSRTSISPLFHSWPGTVLVIICSVATLHARKSRQRRLAFAWITADHCPLVLGASGLAAVTLALSADAPVSHPLLSSPRAGTAMMVLRRLVCNDRTVASRLFFLHLRGRDPLW